jgi:glucan-binding YG repeat protein
MAIGWVQLDGNWYFLQGSGVMATGTHYINGVSYTFDSNGVLID